MCQPKAASFRSRSAGLAESRAALRTAEYLSIRNYRPELWPAGDPPLFGDVDAHMLHYPSPSKMLLLTGRDDPEIRPLFELAFAKRPAEELYDLGKDPDQMNNVADDPAYQQTKQELADQLSEYLERTGDPRRVGGEMKWLGAEYFAERDKTPEPSAEAIEALGLEDRYSYVESAEQ